MHPNSIWKLFDKQRFNYNLGAQSNSCETIKSVVTISAHAKTTQCYLVSFSTKIHKISSQNVKFPMICVVEAVLQFLS